jgi:hypothetical protein
MGLMKHLISLFVVGLICGCAHQHYVAGRGDVGQFILQTAVRYGGSPRTKNGFAAISDQWRYFEDYGGTVIRLAPDKLPDVESFLHQAFGQPVGGHPGHDGYYRLTPHGGGIMFTTEENAAQVIILRSRPLKE